LYSHIEKQIREKILKGFNSPPLLNLGQRLILTILTCEICDIITNVNVCLCVAGTQHKPTYGAEENVVY